MLKKARRPTSAKSNFVAVNKLTIKKMQNLRNFTFLLLLVMGTLGLRAQNGNAVISEVKVYDLGNGTGSIEVRVSGNLSASVVQGTFTISGDRIPGGTVSGGIGESIRVILPEEGQLPRNGNGNNNGNQPVILTGLFSLSAPSGNHPAVFDVTIVLNRPGLGWTSWNSIVHENDVHN